MTLVELDHGLRKLRLSGMPAVLETRLRQAQSEKMTPLDLVSSSSATSSSAVKTGSSNADTHRRAFVTRIARSIVLI
jgi:hypothetical protein